MNAAPLLRDSRRASPATRAGMAFATLMLVGLGTVVASRRASPGAPILMAATGGPIRYGDESLMAGKAHGSCVAPVQPRLRWGCDGKVADNICCFNRHFAERSGYWAATSFLKEANREKTVFRDPVTGRPLFVAPVGRSFSDFEAESRQHGWPSFRQNEVVWANVRVLPNGETVSVDGTHLGHNLPDRKGARYCINLVSISGHTPGGGSDDDDSDVPVGDGQPAPAAAK